MQYFKTGLILIFLSVIYLNPGVILAQIQITEIMYDVPGTDTGREWIEIHNSGSENINPTDFKFLENQVNHKIAFPESYTGSQILESGKYAVIADNIEKFKIDYPNYNGILLDSAFSLNNQGENLAVVDSENNVIHNVNYLPDWGGLGTGNSLQFLDDNWIPAIPTPGALNSSDSIDESASNEGANDSDSSVNGSGGNSTSTPSNDAESSHSGQNSLSNEVAKASLKIGAGRTRYGIINSPIDFLAISNLQAKDHRNLQFDWAFGDAGSGKGFSPEYTYYAPGEYNVVLNAEYQADRNSVENATTRTKVVIREPEIAFSLITSGKHVDILLKNGSKFEVNFGGFYFKFGTESYFEIPKDTILNAGSEITISGEISGFITNDLVGDDKKSGNSENVVKMYYPNGKFLAKKTLILADSLKKDEIIATFLNLQKFVDGDKKSKLEAVSKIILNKYSDN